MGTDRFFLKTNGLQFFLGNIGICKYMDGVNNLIALFGRLVGSQLSAHLHGLFNCTASG